MTAISNLMAPSRAWVDFAIAVFLALFASGAAQALTSGNQISPNSIPVIQLQKDTLVVGSEQDYPPFATGMTDETAGGFSVDLWKAVAAEAGLNYTLRVRPFYQILQEFKEGKIDVLINFAISDERHRYADFTVPHVIVHGAIFVRKGESTLRSEADFTGKSIIVLKADLAHDYAVSKGWEKQLILVDTAAEGMRLLASGKHDAMLLGKLAGMQTLQALNLTNIEALKAPAGFSQKFAFAVREGQSELLGKLNEGLALSKSKGAYDAIYAKWMGVYEVKEVGLSDLLKYLIPVAVVFLGMAAYFFYRRQAEREVSERKYRDLYDHAPDMFLSIQAKTGIIIDCNQAVLDTTGYSRAECIGRPVFELYHPDCADLARSAFRTFMQAKEVQGVELQLRRKDGSKVDVCLNASAACDEHGAILSSRSVLRDITERKRIESEINKARLEVEDLYNNAPCGYHSLDSEGRVIQINQTELDWFGYEREEMIGKRIQDFQTPSGIGVFAKNYPRFKQDGYIYDLEIEMVRKDGSNFTVLLSGNAVKDDEGNFVMTRTTLIDITLRKHAEAALQESEEKFRQLFEKAPVGIAMAEPDQKIFAANAAFCKMFGYSQEEVSNMTIADMVHPDYVAQTGEMVKQVLAGEVPAYSIEKKYVRKNGEVFWGSTVATEIMGENPHKRYIMGMVEDITERIEREAQRLTEVKEQRDVLVREVHHRIKNSLQGVVGLLRRHAVAHPEMADVIDVAIGRIYSIAIIHGLQAQTPTDEINLDILMGSLVDASGAGLEYESELHHTVLLSQDESVPVALVLNELVTNACKHSSEDSVATIRLKMSGDDTLITIANHFDASRLAENDGLGLRLVKLLLPRKSATLTKVCSGCIYTVELKLSPPVTKLGPNNIQ